MREMLYEKLFIVHMSDTVSSPDNATFNIRSSKLNPDVQRKKALGVFGYVLGTVLIVRGVLRGV